MSASVAGAKRVGTERFSQVRDAVVGEKRAGCEAGEGSHRAGNGAAGDAEADGGEVAGHDGSQQRTRGAAGALRQGEGDVAQVGDGSLQNQEHIRGEGAGAGPGDS